MRISYGRFEQAVQKLAVTNASSPLPAAIPTVNFIFIKSGHRTLKVVLDDVLYLSGFGDYVTLFLAGGSKIMALENLSDFEKKLPAAGFCRIHRSHLVALDKITFIERQRVVIGDTWLPISQSYQENFWRIVEKRS